MRFTNTVFTVLRVLQVPLRAVLPFLQGGLRSAGEQRRNSTVVRSLRRAENLQVREELIRCRQRCVAPAGPRFVLKRALPLLNRAPPSVTSPDSHVLLLAVACSITDVLLSCSVWPLQ
jgi:hypothetical protein